MSCTNKITYITLFTYDINIIDAKGPLFSFQFIQMCLHLGFYLLETCIFH